MIKVGIIGCGGMGNYHAPFWPSFPTSRWSARADLIEQKAKALAEKIGVPHCTNFRDLLAHVDAVWVCTEPFNRVEIVTTAAKARKHVFTEKPICNESAGARRMIAATKRYGVKYMLGYCLRFWNPYRLMRDTFAWGKLGELVDCWTRRFMPMDPRPSWYGQQEKSGGVTLDFGSHDINWLLWVGGPVKSVLGRTHRIRDGVQADEHSQTLMLFAGGGAGAVGRQLVVVRIRRLRRPGWNKGRDHRRARRAGPQEDRRRPRADHRRRQRDGRQPRRPGRQKRCRRSDQGRGEERRVDPGTLLPVHRGGPHADHRRRGWPPVMLTVKAIVESSKRGAAVKVPVPR